MSGHINCPENIYVSLKFEAALSSKKMRNFVNIVVYSLPHTGRMCWLHSSLSKHLVRVGRLDALFSH